MANSCNENSRLNVFVHLIAYYNDALLNAELFIVFTYTVKFGGTESDNVCTDALLVNLTLILLIFNDSSQRFQLSLNFRDWRGLWRPVLVR